jgi:ribosome recycling factor
VPTPVNQMASITIPEARVLMVTPFDKNMINDVEKAILASDIPVVSRIQPNITSQNSFFYVIDHIFIKWCNH